MTDKADGLIALYKDTISHAQADLDRLKAKSASYGDPAWATEVIAAEERWLAERKEMLVAMEAERDSIG